VEKLPFLKGEAVRMLHLSREAARQLDVDDLVDLSSFPRNKGNCGRFISGLCSKYHPNPMAAGSACFAVMGIPCSVPTIRSLAG